MIGQSADLLSTDEDRANQVAQREFGEARLNGRTEEERWHLRKDGTRFFASGVLSRWTNPASAGLRRSRAISANSRRRPRPATLQVGPLRESGEQDAVRRRDEFLAVVSHELKNPLNLISASAELIARAPESRQNLNISRAADTIRRTVIGRRRSSTICSTFRACEPASCRSCARPSTCARS